MVNKLPVVGHMQGLRHTGGAHLKEGRVFLQYTDEQENWQEIEMQLGDAMYLLSLLKGLQLNLGIPFPDDPRAPQ